MMELERGTCELCYNEEKVIKPPQAQNILKSLQPLLKDKIDKNEFHRIQSILRACPQCLQHIEIMKNTKVTIPKETVRGSRNRKDNKCHLCLKNNELVAVTDWALLQNAFQSIWAVNITDCMLCLGCILFLNTLESMKNKLLLRYPELLKIKTEEIHTPTGNDKLSLGHLTPLKLSNIPVEEIIRSDKKFMDQVLYVKLPNSEIKVNQEKHTGGSQNSFTNRRKGKGKHEEDVVDSTSDGILKESDVDSLDLTLEITKKTPELVRKRNKLKHDNDAPDTCSENTRKKRRESLNSSAQKDKEEQQGSVSPSSSTPEDTISKRKRGSVSPTTQVSPKTEDGHKKRKRESVTPIIQGPSNTESRNRRGRRNSSSPTNHIPDTTKSIHEAGEHSKHPPYFKIKFKPHQAKKPKPKLKKPTNLDIDSELLKHNITKELKVNILQSNFESVAKEEPSSSQELDTSFLSNTKKRKSVSFAEEKNVQIEYIDYPSSNVSVMDENSVAAKKVLKPSLKKTVDPVNPSTEDTEDNLDPNEDNASNDQEELDTRSADQEISDQNSVESSEEEGRCVPDSTSETKNDASDGQRVDPDSSSQEPENEDKVKEISETSKETHDSEVALKDADSSDKVEDILKNEVPESSKEDSSKKSPGSSEEVDSSQEIADSSKDASVENSTKNDEDRTKEVVEDSSEDVEDIKDSSKDIKDSSKDIDGSSENVETSSKKVKDDSPEQVDEPQKRLDASSGSNGSCEKTTESNEKGYVSSKEDNIPTELEAPSLDSLKNTLIHCDNDNGTGNDPPLLDSQEFCSSDSESDKHVLDKVIEDMTAEDENMDLNNDSDQVPTHGVTSTLLDQGTISDTLDLNVSPEDIIDDDLK